MKLFLGEYDHTIDERGRVMMPKKMRGEIVGRDIVLSRGYDGCIFGFDRSSWEHEAQKHLEVSVTDAEARSIRRYLFSSAESVELDRLGRILLPTQLKEYAHIDKDVVVVGAGDHFELWSKPTWIGQRQKMERPV